MKIDTCRHLVDGFDRQEHAFLVLMMFSSFVDCLAEFAGGF